LNQNKIKPATETLIIISEILHLRPIEMSDAKSIARYADNINVWKNLTDIFPHPYTLSDAVTFINAQKEFYPKRNFSIVYLSEPIGVIGISINEKTLYETIEIGYWIGEPFWNKGIGTAVIKKFTSYCFDTFKNTSAIKATVFNENIASARALEKAGFKKIKNGFGKLTKNGELKDISEFKIFRQITK
jgi:RimJ/RimL family protein N-acetyltransferase